MINKLHIDVETYSSTDIRISGAYKYVESIDFDLLLVAYAFNNEPIKIIDLAQSEQLPEEFIRALNDSKVIKCAHNANFERNVFRKLGYDIPIDEWHCTAVKSAYCGLPLALEQVSKVLKLGEKGKIAAGKALIRFFCLPIKPTSTNDFRHRNFPWHHEQKWEEFKLYCINDVKAEREIENKLTKYKLPAFEKGNYILDQQINDRGILVDLDMAKKAYKIDEIHSSNLGKKIIEITGVENPNSPAQLKKWIGDAVGKEIKSLAKDVIPILIEEVGPGPVLDVLNLRSKSSKTSIKKYKSMLNCACDDNRIRGLFQFYGANRTGRYAGRLVQLHNLKRNYLKNLDQVRKYFKTGDYDLITILFENISESLSQLIRTAFVAKNDHVLGIADFSAIEARITAWLANEKWRLEVFNTHGKIYEASAAYMFGVPIEKVTKGSDLRDKGKIAELALGYQGSLGALKKMGGESMGLSDSEMRTIVKKWRASNPKITRLWKRIESSAKIALKTGKKQPLGCGFCTLEFDYDGNVLTIKLPSGRKLFYQQPSFTVNKFGMQSIQYKGIDQTTKQWINVDTYGGKLTENIVQAIARDVLADSMLRLNKNDFDIVIHVHDEIGCELHKNTAEKDLEKMINIMSQEIPWAKQLPLGADGFISPFYKKD